MAFGHRNHDNSSVRKLLASALAVFLFLATLEIGLRLVYKPRGPFRFYAPHSESIVQRDSKLGYRLRPNIKASAYKSFIETNRLGFRGAEFNPASKTGTRIVALGDSCTFGFGVSDNAHTYPAVLSTLARAEVINAGVVGYTSYQAATFLETQLVEFHPDILLIYIGWNDLGNSILPDWTPAMIQDVESNSSRLYALSAFRDLFSSVKRRGRIGFKPEAVEVYGANLHRIVMTARGNGIRPVLLTWPTRVAGQIEELQHTEILNGTGITMASWFEYYRKYQDKLRTIAEQDMVQVIPLAEQLNSKDANYYVDEIHLSDLGASAAAKVISESLREPNL
jgi:lysophospholipase L1-like esterase